MRIVRIFSPIGVPPHQYCSPTVEDLHQDAFRIATGLAQTQALEVLVTMPDGQRTALGQKARRSAVDNFALEKAVKEYEAIYIEIANAAGPVDEPVAGKA